MRYIYISAVSVAIVIGHQNRRRRLIEALEQQTPCSWERLHVRPFHFWGKCNGRFCRRTIDPALSNDKLDYWWTVRSLVEPTVHCPRMPVPANKRVAAKMPWCEKSLTVSSLSPLCYLDLCLSCIPSKPIGSYGKNLFFIFRMRTKLHGEAAFPYCDPQLSRSLPCKPESLNVLKSKPIISLAYTLSLYICIISQFLFKILATFISFLYIQELIWFKSLLISLMSGSSIGKPWISCSGCYCLVLKSVLM